MTYSAQITTSLTITCDNCGDQIYSGADSALDDTAFVQFGYALGTGLSAIQQQAFLCAGKTCAHNCQEALRQAFNALPARVAPAIPPLQSPVPVPGV